MKKTLTKLISTAMAIALLCGLLVPFASASNTFKCYTISSSNTPVYSNTALTKKIGAIYGTDEVYIISGTTKYAKVSYPISGNRMKTGYIATSAIVVATSGPSCTSSGKIPTYRRPDGKSYGYVAKGDRVMVLGRSGNYTQLKYPVQGGYKYAWVTSSNASRYLSYGGQSTVSSDSGASYYKQNVGRVIANTGSYSLYLDGYRASKGQCVWYVRNRGYEKLGNAGLTGIGGNANVWYSTARSRGKSVGTTPRSNSIACWNGGKYGHVVFVEYFDSSSNMVYFTEANWKGSQNNGVLKVLSLSSFKKHCSGYQGCIYL